MTSRRRPTEGRDAAAGDQPAPAAAPAAVTSPAALDGGLDHIFALDIGLICVAGGDGRFARLNPGWQRALGWTLAELMARPVLDFVHPDDRVRTAEATAGLLAGERLVGFDNRYLCNDGSYRTLAWSAVADEVRGVIFASAHDVTAERATARELRRARDTVGAALAQKAQFVANMSHELRTPLTGVLGLAELLVASPLDAQQLAWVGLIRDAGQQLLTVLTDLRDFSGLERGGAGPVREDVDLRTLLRHTVELFRPAAVTAGIGLTWDIASDVPASAEVDAGRLRQVLTHVVGNAVKFTPAGGVTVTVTRSTSCAGIDFAVSDTGVGIAAADLQRIFEPFVQVDMSDARRFGGTGLGLTLAAELVRHLSGRITVVSEVGHGSTFTVTVPLPGPVAGPAGTAGATEA